MSSDQYICDRQQCLYIGPRPVAKSRSQRLLRSGLVTTLVHIGCFPLLLILPVSFPIFMLVFMYRSAMQCPACRKGLLIAIESERGQALTIARESRS